MLDAPLPLLTSPLHHSPLCSQIIAGFAGAEVDKLFETKGLDFLDQEKAKYHAKEEAKQQYEQRYENNY